MLEGEREKLLAMEDYIGKRIIGQADAVKAVPMQPTGTGWPCRPDQPMGSFLMLGPTGVGKTELSKALANFFLMMIGSAKN